MSLTQYLAGGVPVANRIGAIVADRVVNSAKVNKGFLWVSQAPSEFIQPYLSFGTISLEGEGTSGPNIHPMLQNRGIKNGLKPLMYYHWHVQLVDRDQTVLKRKVMEDHGSDTALQHLLKEIPNCIVLIDKAIFNRITIACIGQRIALDAFLYKGELRSYYDQRDVPKSA